MAQRPKSRCTAWGLMACMWPSGAVQVSPTGGGTETAEGHLVSGAQVLLGHFGVGRK